MRHFGYPTKQLIRYTEVLALFPGFPVCKLKWQAIKSWVGPGNEATEVFSRTFILWDTVMHGMCELYLVPTI